METLKNLTLVQWIGIMVGLNSLLMGATPQLTVLFGTVAVPYIIAIATLGNGALGVFVTVVGGQRAQIRNVAAMPGVDSIRVNANANQTLASIAVSGAPEAKNVEPIPTAETKVSAIAKGLAVLFAILLGATLFSAGDAHAQIKKPQITGDLAADTRANFGLGGQSTPVSKGLNDLLGALDEKLLPDLIYAKKMADATGSNVTAPCYQSWIDLINKRKTAVTNADGTAMDLPNPRLVTDFEKAVELRNALQPDSEFMLKCSPVANMIKQDMIAFIGKVLAGGAGLATLVPGL